MGEFSKELGDFGNCPFYVRNVDVGSSNLLSSTRLRSSPPLADRNYARWKVKCVQRREKTGALYYRRALEALEALAEKAAAFGVRLAIESRSRYEDVPTEREMVALQEHFSDHPWVGYWHDFGHVQLKHNLGLLDHPSWLRRMKSYLLGAHVHDVDWPHRDHRVPFTGTLDYRRLLPELDPALPHVWELSPGRRTEEIRDALVVWKELFPATLTRKPPDTSPSAPRTQSAEQGA